MHPANPEFFYHVPIHHHPYHGRNALLSDDLNLRLCSILDYVYSANHLGGDGNHRRLSHRQTLTGVRHRPSPTGAEALRAPSAPMRLVFKNTQPKHTNNNATTTHHISSYGNHSRLSHRQTLTGVRLRPSPAGAEALREPSARRDSFSKTSTRLLTLYSLCTIATSFTPRPKSGRIFP